MADGDRVAATLAEAKRTADALHFACRIPGKVPDFTACGGPAAEAYWNYFTPARISSLLAAVEAALKLADHWEWEGYRLDAEAFMVCAAALREAITAALAGEADGR